MVYFVVVESDTFFERDRFEYVSKINSCKILLAFLAIKATAKPSFENFKAKDLEIPGPTPTIVQTFVIILLRCNDNFQNRDERALCRRFFIFPNQTANRLVCFSFN